MNAKLSLQSRHPSGVIGPNSAGSQADNPRLLLWLSKLPKHSLPVNDKIARKLRLALEDPHSTSEKLADLVQQDPALCLKLFLRGQRQIKQRQGDIQGLVHLIGLLGLDQIEATLAKATKEAAPSEGQRELFAASIFAGHLAKQLLPIKHGTKGQYFFLPSLLFNAPLWLMWVAAPKLMKQGQTLASQKRRPLEPLCKKSLGFSLQSLLEQTQVFLPLPEITLKALDIDPHKNMALWAKFRRLDKDELKRWFEKDKKAKQLFYSAETGIYLINHYVLAIYLDWQGKHIRRWSSLLSHHLGIDHDELDKYTAAIATQFKLPNHLSGQYAPIYRFRGLHKELGDDKPSGNSVSNKAILDQYLNQLRESKTIGNCLQLTLEAFSQGAKVDHCLILTVNDDHITAPLSYGFEEAAGFSKTGVTDEASIIKNSTSMKNEGKQAETNIQTLSSLDIDCDDCGQLLKALLEKPMAVIIDQNKLNKVQKQLPLALTRYWQPRPCGLMSLFRDGKPYAIVLCDHSEWDTERHQQFKAIGKQLSQTLKQCRHY